MRTRRFFFFFLAILVGAGAGLAFGWLFMPPKTPVNANLTQLRADYKTDLVLMTAEKFQAEKDAVAALDQLSQIDTGDPLSLLVNAIKYAEGIGYSQQDLATMRSMFNGISADTYQAWKAKEALDGE